MPIMDMGAMKESAEFAELRLRLLHFIEFEQVMQINDYAYDWATRTTFSNKMIVRATLNEAYELGAQGKNFDEIFKGVKNFLEVESAYAKILEVMGVYRP